VIERRDGHNLWLQRKEASCCDKQFDGYYVIEGGLEKPLPGQGTLHQHVVPERGWSGLEFERRKPVRKNQVPQVAKENLGPQRQFDHKLQIVRGLRILVEPVSGHLSMVDAGIRFE
jgi:hypothetical protein